MQYLTASVSRLGHRKKNQDRITTLNRQGSVLLALADGMGGRPGGELAAQCLIDTATCSFATQELPIRDPAVLMQQIMSQAHNTIISEGLAQIPPINPGTTAVLCLLQAGFAWWSHVGDSRLYLFRDGQFIERTQDHSVVANLQAGGKLSADHSSAHPLRNVITRCLGMSKNPPIITMSQKIRLKEGDIMLLCSDGFWEPLTEAAMAKQLYCGRLQHGLEQLAAQAEEINAPGSDNISAIALQVMNTGLS